MILRIAQDCTLSIRSLDDSSEVSMAYEAGYLITNCRFSEPISGQFPDIIFVDEDDELTGYRALSVPQNLYEKVGEEMVIQFLHDIPYDEDDAFDTSPGRNVKCKIYGYQNGAEAVDIEIDGVMFRDVNSEIFEIVERVSTEDD